MTSSTKVNLALDTDTLAAAREAAGREGVTLSAYLSRAARREVRRTQGRQYQEWLQAHPDVAEEVREWRAYAGSMQAQRWAHLAELDQDSEHGQAAA